MCWSSLFIALKFAIILQNPYVLCFMNNFSNKCFNYCIVIYVIINFFFFFEYGLFVSLAMV
ncbi:hypothetical protein IC582_006945 [Cucumis melo]